MAEWEKQLYANVQTNMGGILRDILLEVTPKARSFWKEVLNTMLHGVTMGLPLAVMYYFLK